MLNIYTISFLHQNLVNYLLSVVTNILFFLFDDIRITVRYVVILIISIIMSFYMHINVSIFVLLIAYINLPY